MRLGLHPGGLAPRIANLPEWRRHLLDRLYRQVTLTNDRTLLPLLEELRAYPVTESQPPPGITAQEKIFVPLQLASLRLGVVIDLRDQASAAVAGQVNP